MTKRNIVHIEIPAADTAKAGEFYNKLFGWDIHRDADMDYTMWDAGDGPGGGFTSLSEEVKPGDVLVYVNSDDIDSDLLQAEALGGTIIYPKTEIPNTGWFGMFKDPTGNTIAVYTDLNPG